MLHYALASCGAVYCNLSCLWVCNGRAGGRTGGREVSEPYYSQRAQCFRLSERFFHSEFFSLSRVFDFIMNLYIRHSIGMVTFGYASRRHHEFLTYRHDIRRRTYACVLFPSISGCTITVSMPPPPRVWCIKRRCVSDVCLTSVAYIGLKLRTERHRKTKISTEVAHVTRDSDTTFNVKRSKVKVTRPLRLAVQVRPTWTCTWIHMRA